MNYKTRYEPDMTIIGPIHMETIEQIRALQTLTGDTVDEVVGAAICGLLMRLGFEMQLTITLLIKGR